MVIVIANMPVVQYSNYKGLLCMDMFVKDTVEGRCVDHTYRVSSIQQSITTRFGRSPLSPYLSSGVSRLAIVSVEVILMKCEEDESGL
jgi:hypothetical protein